MVSGQPGSILVHNHAEWCDLKGSEVRTLKWMGDRMIHPDEISGESSIFIVFTANPVSVREFNEVLFSVIPEEWGTVGVESTSAMEYAKTEDEVTDKE